MTSILLGCGALVFSQVSTCENRLVPKNILSFTYNVDVPFHEHGIPEYFSFQVLIDQLDSYVVAFADSDLLIDRVNITAPNHSVVTLNCDFSFNLLNVGLHVFSVEGHY